MKKRKAAIVDVAVLEARLVEVDEALRAMKVAGKSREPEYRLLAMEKARLVRRTSPGSLARREKQTGEAAEDRFRAFLATGTAYRFLLQATEFMTNRGFKVLRELAEGKPCGCGFKGCPQREPDMRAFKLLADSLRVVADAELAMAQKQRLDEEGAEGPAIDWPAEGVKA